MKPKKIGIIGSGIAGLASAVRLASKGHIVTVFEKEAVLGGKMGFINEKGYRFDTGPSLFTQPYLIDDILKYSNSNEEFSYEQLQISCKYFWEDGTVFSAFENKKQLSDELKKVFPEDKNSFLKRLNKAEEMYNLIGDIFIEKPLNKLSTWFNKDVFKAIPQMPKFKLNKTMSEANKHEFRSEKVNQIFNRFATYNGSSPYKAPAILNMIPHLELNQGTFYPKGGLRSIPETLIKEGERLGVSYKTQEGVDQILTTSKKVTGIKTAEGIYKFDIVISNADVHSTYKKLLKEVPAPKKVLNQERSSSGIIFYWGVKKEFPELELHNIFFSETYKEEFKALFETGSIIEDPTVYLNISSKVDQNDSPKGAENWFILINAPANKGQDWDVLIKQVRKNVIKKLERILNQEIEKHIDFEAVLDPRIIERKTSSYQGSLYGSSSNNKYAAFLRHTNNHKNIDGLYFCGGSVHPGGGIPLCLNSAKIVSNLI